MAHGVTADGFVRKTFEEIDAEVSDYWREKISPHLQLDEKTVLGNVGRAGNEQAAQLWEVAESAYQAFDPDNADDVAFVALCELTGTKQRAATKGLVSATCNFDASKTYAPGALVAHIEGQPGNRWVNRDQATSTTAGNYTVIFQAETAGAQGVAQAGTLIVIAQSVNGWNSVTNALASDPDGQDVEKREELEVRRVQELSAAGARTLRAIRAAVSKVPGVLNVDGRQNRTDYLDIATGLPPHSIQIRIWDGAGQDASDDAVAQAIFDAAADGIECVGASSGTATDGDTGEFEDIPFSRAAAVQVYIEISVQGVTTEAQVKAAIAALEPTKPGETIVALRLRGAPLALPGVIDVTAFTLGLAPSPVGTVNIVPNWETILRIDPANIAVTIV